MLLRLNYPLDGERRGMRDWSDWRNGRATPRKRDIARTHANKLLHLLLLFDRTFFLCLACTLNITSSQGTRGMADLPRQWRLPVVHQMFRRSHKYGAADGIAEDCRRLVEEHPTNGGVGTQQQAVTHKEHYIPILAAPHDDMTALSK